MKTKTPTLFDIEPTKTSRHILLRDFKAEHGILTHNARWAREDHPWLALQAFDEDKGKDIALIIAESCRLYEESGRVSTGSSEIAAVRGICAALKIACPL